MKMCDELLVVAAVGRKGKTVIYREKRNSFFHTVISVQSSAHCNSTRSCGSTRITTKPKYFRMRCSEQTLTQIVRNIRCMLTMNNIEKKPIQIGCRCFSHNYRVEMCAGRHYRRTQTHRKCIGNHYVWHSFPSASCQIELFRCCACKLRHCQRHRWPLFTYLIYLSIYMFIYFVHGSTTGVDFTRSSIVLRSTYSVHDVYGSQLYVEKFLSNEPNDTTSIRLHSPLF